MRAFFVGLQFLTRISVIRQREWRPRDFGRSVRYFPLIGLTLGICYTLFAWVITEFLPQEGWNMPSHIRAFCLMTLPILFTGGLHCDGFMDTMDGLLSGRERARALEIMKDSRTGSYGVVSFILLCFWNFSVFYDMGDSTLLLPALLFMPIWARLWMAYAVICFPYARPQGMGKAFKDWSTLKDLGFALFSSLVLFMLISVGMHLLFGPPWGYFASASALASFILTFLFTVFFARSVTRFLGGLTGDVYGAITLFVEVMSLTIFLFMGHYFGVIG